MHMSEWVSLATKKKKKEIKKNLGIYISDGSQYPWSISTIPFISTASALWTGELYPKENCLSGKSLESKTERFQEEKLL